MLREASRKEMPVLGLEESAGAFWGDRGLVGQVGVGVGREIWLQKEAGDILAPWDHVLNSDCITGDF